MAVGKRWKKQEKTLKRGKIKKKKKKKEVLGIRIQASIVCSLPNHMIYLRKRQTEHLSKNYRWLN